MNIFNVIAVVEEADSLTSFAFPCSSEEIAEQVSYDVEELYGEDLITCAIIESQIDQGLSKQRAIVH